MKTIHTFAIALTALLLPTLATRAGNPELPVDLRSAVNFGILAKAGISTVTGSSVIGDMGVSPIAATGITGFSLILDGSGNFSTSTQVIGKVYAADYADPTPIILTTAVSDMQTAYTDAAGRTTPDHTELAAGVIGGLVLAPGLYKWGTSVLIDANVTLNGGANAVWIFQIAGDLTVANSTAVILTGGAQSKNIFWQVAGGAGANIGTTAHVEGVILTQTAITLQTGSSVNGRLLAQTAVTLQSNAITAPLAPTNGTLELRSSPLPGGPYTYAPGQYISRATKNISAPRLGNTRFYIISADPEVLIKGIKTPGGSTVINYN